MVSVAIFGDTRIDGSMVDPGERIIAVALFGGSDFDFVTVSPPPAVEVIIVTLFGSATLKVRARQALRINGLSLSGSRSIDPLLATPAPSQADDCDALDQPIEINAYALFGGISVSCVEAPHAERADP